MKPNVDRFNVRFIASFILFFSAFAVAQTPVATTMTLQQQAQMDMMMRQMYPQYLTPQQQLQLAQVPPGQRLQVLQAINMGNNQYAMQFTPQSGPQMGQSMWAMNNTQSPLFNFFSSLGSITKSMDRVEYMEAREPVTAYRSPDPSENREPSQAALDTMNQATSKLKDMKNPQKATECLDCITDPLPTLTAGPISGVGTVKTSAVGGRKEDLNADVKCSFGGEVIDGIRLTFKQTLEMKIEHNKVISFKLVAQDGKKTCVIDLANFPQKQIGNTTNVGLNHKNGKTYVAIYPNNKTDRKNPAVSVGVNNFQDLCPQMNPKLFMQIEADPKTGTCR